MKRTIALVACCSILALTSCARQAVPDQAPPATPAAAPTSSLSGFSDLTPTTAPTTEAITSNDPTFTVQRGDITNQLTLDGRVALVQQGVAFSESGIIAEVFVERGQQVEQGQLIAQLDSSDLQSQLIQAQADYRQSNSAMQQAVDAAQIEVRRAELGLEAARSELEKTKQPVSADTIATQRAEVLQADAALATVRNNASANKNNALEDLNTAANMLREAQAVFSQATFAHQRKKTSESQLYLDEARRAMLQAEEDLKKAQIAYDTAANNEIAAVKDAEAALMASKARLEKLLAGPDTFEVAAAERAVRDAQLVVDEARLSAKPNPELLRTVTIAENQIQNLERQIEGRRLYAPLSGQVFAIEVNSGMTASAGSPVIIIAANNQREIIAAISTDVSAAQRNTRLVVGQTVELTFPRYPGQTLSGSIARVPGRAVDNPDIVTTEASYAISYDASSLSLDPGDLAEVHVLIGSVSNALWLPPEAIRTSRDRSFVLLRDGEEDRRVDIQVGLASEERVEILRGLNEGDVVVGVTSR